MKIKKKIIKNNSYLSQIFKKKIIFRKCNCMSKIFTKIDFKFYFKITIHNQTYNE